MHNFSLPEPETFALQVVVLWLAASWAAGHFWLFCRHLPGPGWLRGILFAAASLGLAVWLCTINELKWNCFDGLTAGPVFLGYGALLALPGILCLLAERSRPPVGTVQQLAGGLCCCLSMAALTAAVFFPLALWSLGLGMVYGTILGFRAFL